MADYKSIFMSYLDQEGIKYTDRSEFVVKVVYSGDNLNTIPIYVFFDEDRDPIVQLQCWEIINFKGKIGRAVEACNTLNNEYRWIKFRVDNDADIVASIDAYIDAETGGPECLNLVRRIVNIVDDAYPTLAKALWA
ncbi:MAG: YbjN domain-containing protein [Clostridia bacterium]|nr:YbjN domain-containing protein [Clostridia bacterium]